MSDSRMVSVPRELLAAWAERLSKAQIFKESSEVRALLAAPAEDVRAVVDEPVAFIQIPKNVEKYGHGADPDRLKFGKPGQFFANGESPLFDFVPLYRHPQRPVVLPDRLREVWLFLDGQAELEGCVFGEKPEGRHNFWWRKELRAVLEELYPQQ